MGNINLNDETYDVSENVAIINDGKAGIAEDLMISLEKKKKDDPEKSPNYKIIFKDDAGASCNTPFWYITEPTKYKSIEKQTLDLGKRLKHIIHALLGKDYKLPEFADSKVMLDQCMKIIYEAIKKGVGKVRIFANFGTVDYGKAFIQPRSWVPFIEPMTVDLENTRLVVSDIDGMERIKKDTFDSDDTSEGKPSTESDDDDDWD